MQFASKLTEADLNDVRKMTRTRDYWVRIFYVTAMVPLLGWRTWKFSSVLLSRTPPDWPPVAVLVAVFTCFIPVSVYLRRRTRSQQLTQLNRSRPDQITLTNDGIKCDGPNGATSLVPWRNFKGWRKGRRVVLVERSDGNRYVILPVAPLSDIERQPIRRFLQSQIASIRL